MIPWLLRMAVVCPLRCAGWSAWRILTLKAFSMSDLVSDLPLPLAGSDVLLPEASPPGLTAALAWLEGLAERDGWPARTLFALTLCADEALTNVLAYTSAPAAGAALQLRLECARTADGVLLRIEDNGAAFDPTAQQSPALAPSLDDALVGGHGLRLMRHYLRTLHYQRQGDGNVLLLEAAWAA